MKTIHAFGQNLVVFNDNQGSFVWAPKGQGEHQKVYLNDPLFKAKEMAYTDLATHIESLYECFDNQIASHKKWYNYWMAKLGLAKEEYNKAVPVRDTNHKGFVETLAKAGCSYLELGTKNDTQSKELKKEADEFYGLEHDAQRTIWRSTSRENTYIMLAFDEQKCINQNMQMKAIAQNQLDEYV